MMEVFVVLNCTDYEGCDYYGISKTLDAAKYRAQEIEGSDEWNTITWSQDPDSNNILIGTTPHSCTSRWQIIKETL